MVMEECSVMDSNYLENNYEEKLLKEKEDILSTKKTIILFGTMAIGLVAKKTLDFLSVKTACFCDNNKQKQGKSIDGLQVLSPEQAKEKYPDAKIFICSFKEETCKSIKKQLIKLGFNDINCKDMFLYVYQIQIMKRPIDSKEYAKTLYKLSHKYKYLTLPSIAITVTTKCSLRCKDCGALIPFIKNPIHFNKEEIIKSMNILSQSVDAIKEFGIQGGEALLYPDLVEICDAASKLNNIGLVKIITNGTIIPKLELLKSIKNSVMYILVSDYGYLSIVKSKLEKMAKDNNVCLEIKDEDSEWIDCGNLIKRNRSVEENEEIFQKCFHRYECHEVINGELHFCGHSGSGKIIGLFHDNEKDYVNLIDDSINLDEMREKTSDFIRNTKYITACDYCDWSFEKKIPPAIQLEN